MCRTDGGPSILGIQPNGFFSKQLKTVRQEHGQMAFERKSFFFIHLNITILIKANKRCPADECRHPQRRTIECVAHFLINTNTIFLIIIILLINCIPFCNFFLATIFVLFYFIINIFLFIFFFLRRPVIVSSAGIRIVFNEVPY